MTCKIIGIGGYLPGNPIPNSALEKDLDTSDEWITSRTGITQRYFAEESLVEMSYKASIEAIKNSKISQDEIELVIVCTTTPDTSFPSTATKLQGLLGLKNIPSFDLNGVCSGFVYGIHVANSLMRTSNYNKVLVVGADKMSSLLDMKDRSVDILFGDGAGAVILEKSTNVIFDSIIGSSGEYADILKTEKLENNHHKIYMKGREVYRHAVEKMTSISLELLAINNLTLQDIDYFVPHQANLRIIEAVGNQLNIDMSKVITTVSIHANTSSATIPLALEEMRKSNILKSPKLVLMVAIGAGLTFGGSLIECSNENDN